MPPPPQPTPVSKPKPAAEKVVIEANPSKDMMRTSMAMMGCSGVLMGMGVGVPPSLLNR